MTTSKSRASSVPSAANALRAWTRAPSERVVRIDSSTLSATRTGRPVAHAPSAASGSTFVYDFVP
jgi:hypothetical protein